MKPNIIILFFLLHFFSFSQERDSTSVLLDEIVLTGQYVPTHIDSSIYFIHIIKKEDINSFGSQNLSSVLSRQIGMDIFYDQFLGSYVDFKGLSGENIKVLIDGVEMSGLQNGSVDFSQININGIERIEIVEGPLSVIYGNNSLGATINLISKKNQDEKINISLQSYLESIGQYNFNTHIGYKQKDNLFFISLGRNYFDGWSDTDNFLSFETSHKADSSRFQDWKPKEQFFINSRYLYKAGNLTIKPYLDFFSEEVINKGFPRGAFLHYAFDEHYLTNRFDKGIVIKGPFLNRNIDVLFHHNQYKRIKTKYRKDLTTLAEYLTEDYDTTSISFFTHRITCSNIENKKINYQYGYAINHENINTLRAIEGDQQRTNFSFFYSFDYHLLGADLRAAARYLYSDKNENALTPSINLKFNLGPVLTRLSYGHGFRVPSLKEMYFNFIDVNHYIQGNPELKSERSNNIQINLSSHFLNHHILTFNTFYNRIRDFITLLQNENTTTFDYFNIGNYKTLGAKLGVDFNLSNSNFNVDISYLGRDLDDSNLDFYTSFNTSLTHKFNSKHAMSIFYSFKGPRSYISKNTIGEISVQNIDLYHMLDISYTVNLLSDVIDFSIGCNNILNVQNIDAETLISTFHNSESNGIPISCGRFIFTSLKMNFKK